MAKRNRLGRIVRNKSTGRKNDLNSNNGRFQAKPKQRKDKASRNRARRIAIKAGIIKEGDPRDIIHKDGNVRNNSVSNLAAQSKNKNRSFKRTKKAGKKNPRS